MLFVGMLALQLAGALLLLLNCIKGSKEAVIKNCFPGSNVVTRDDKDNCTIEKARLQESAHKIYLNIAAFCDLVLGYALAAFSPAARWSTGITVLGVAGTTIVFLILENHISQRLAKRNYPQDMIVPFHELAKNGVDTIATDREMDEILYGTGRE